MSPAAPNGLPLNDGPLNDGPLNDGPLNDGSAIGVIPEAVDEAAEDAALMRQRRLRSRGLGAFLADRLLVVGPGDGVHDLGLVELLRAGDLRHEADQVAVEQHFGLQAGGALASPDGPAAAQAAPRPAPAGTCTE